MVQPAVLPVNKARAEKFAPRTQEVRNRFARIKRELRRIERMIARQPSNNAKA